MGLYSVRSYNGANPDYHRVSDTSLYKATDGDFVCGCCFWLQSTSGVQEVFNKLNSSSNGAWRFAVVSGEFRFFLIESTGDFERVVKSVSAQEFHFAVGYFDSTRGKIGLILDDSSPVELDFGSPTTNDAAPTSVGVNGNGGSPLTGRVGRCFFARPPSSTTAIAAEIATAHHNGGAGLLAAELTEQQKTDWGLVSWSDGNMLRDDLRLVDQIGGVTFTASGSPGLADGPEQPDTGAATPRILSPYLIGDVG